MENKEQIEQVEETEETNPTEEKIEEKVKEQEPKFTQEELDNIIQKRLERAMTKAEEERKQAEELAKLSEKERAAKELEIKEKELEQERKEFYRERLELQTTKELDKIGLPIAFTEYVIGDNAEETQDRIKKFNELWETEVEKRRIESLRGKTPVLGGKSQSMTREDIIKMPYKEQIAFKADNLELYNQLMNG